MEVPVGNHKWMGTLVRAVLGYDLESRLKKEG